MVSEEIAGLRLVRLRGPGGRVAVGVVGGDEVGVLEAEDVVTTLQASELPAPTERVALLDAQACTPAEPWSLLAPLVAPETWAAGVTYPSCSSRTPPVAARSDQGSRSPPAPMPRGRCPSPSSPSCSAPTAHRSR